MAIAPKVWSYLPYHVVCFIPHILCVLDTFYTMPDKGVCPSKKGHGFVGKGVCGLTCNKNCTEISLQLLV